MIHVVAVGQRLPDWAQVACDDYLARFPREFKVTLTATKTEPRHGKTPQQLMQAEAERILDAVGPDAFVVVLDEHGSSMTTIDFAHAIKTWRSHAHDIAFVIGGPDGLADTIKARANAMMKLSDMTLPHALARVLLLEQLYRVWSIFAKHPYHRA